MRYTALYISLFSRSIAQFVPRAGTLAGWIQPQKPNAPFGFLAAGWLVGWSESGVVVYTPGIAVSGPAVGAAPWLAADLLDVPELRAWNSAGTNCYLLLAVATRGRKGEEIRLVESTHAPPSATDEVIGNVTIAYGMRDWSH